MPMRMISALVFVSAIWLNSSAVAQSASAPSGAPRVDVQEYLSSGKLSEAERKLGEALKVDPHDDQTRLGLGMVQALRSVEHLMQALHKYGLRSGPGNGMLSMAVGGLPPLPIAPNSSPQEIGYDDFRAILQTWVTDLNTADETLSKLGESDVKLAVQIGLVRLDFDGDGSASEDESLWKVYQRLNRGADISLDDAKQLIVGFDRADAEWLRGYCNLLTGFGEFFLAYDEHELFERTFHLIFPRVKSPHESLRNRGDGRDFEEFREIADWIAFIHLINFPLKEPARMQAALKHLETMSACSRRMWKFVQAETDDDHEWIPSPKQTGIVPDVKFTPEMVQGWMEFLDEIDAILAGKKLLPFWRGGDDSRGFNLHKFFVEPQPFDLVLWVQGTAATPYLEKGPVTKSETWQRLDRIFEGQFVGIAFWLN